MVGDRRGLTPIGPTIAPAPGPSIVISGPIYQFTEHYSQKPNSFNYNHQSF